MKSRHILAVDQGTTNTKGVLVNDEGRVSFRASLPMSLTTTPEGHVEQDANQIWEVCFAVIKVCLEKVGAEGIAGIGISNQRETVVLWDRTTGQPVTPAVLWQCPRSAARCAALVDEGKQDFIKSRTGLRIDPLFSASKVEWLLDHTKDLRARAEAGEICFGTVDSWLISKMTAGAYHVTDASNASRTQLLNLGMGAWDQELLELFRIPAAMLPRLVDSSGVIGETACMPGVPAGIPIASAIGDSHAALVGQGVFAPGPVKATYGTGSSLMTLCDGVGSADSPLSKTIAWTVAGSRQYAWEGNITMTGAAVQWVGEFLQSQNPVESALALASSVKDAGGVYLVPAMSGLGAPHWDSKARGAIYGLTRTTSVRHLARAAVEAIAFQVADVFEEMQSRQPGIESALFADGGASENSGLMQFQADLLGCPVLRSKCTDLSALGAAWLAGLGLGQWQSIQDLAKLAPEPDVFEPELNRRERERLLAGWRLAVARTRFEPRPG